MTETFGTTNFCPICEAPIFTPGAKLCIGCGLARDEGRRKRRNKQARLNRKARADDMRDIGLVPVRGCQSGPGC